jgi:3-methyladenine DNA glycosylase AlkD
MVRIVRRQIYPIFRRNPKDSMPKTSSRTAIKKKPKSTAKKRLGKKTKQTAMNVDDVVTKLKRLGTKKTRDGMARYAIPSDNAFGVPVGTIRAVGKELGRNHDLAHELWNTGWYEARMLASFVDEPDRVTPEQMDRWCRDFDNWAICDTICFHLFDRTPHAFAKVKQWASKRNEFEKRAAFALLASLGVHDKKSSDESFAKCLPLIERASTDNRNFVKKGVSWALRVVGRRSVALNEASVKLSEKLSKSDDAAARWIGKDAYKELTSAMVVRRLKARGVK